MRNPVPYALLARAADALRDQFPDASQVRALWTPSSRTEVTVEVWHGNRADVYSWEPTR